MIKIGDRIPEVVIMRIPASDNSDGMNLTTTEQFAGKVLLFALLRHYSNISTFQLLLIEHASQFAEKGI